MTDDFKDEAALFALGTLSGEEYETARERAEHDPAFAAAVASREADLAAMVLRAPAASASKNLLSRIEARLDAGLAAPSGKTIRAGEGQWIALAPGLRMKQLNRMRELGRQTILLDVRPGALYEGHDHDQDEEIFMISGDLSFGDVVLGPGDYHLAPKGTRHPRATTQRGCLCVVVCGV